MLSSKEGDAETGLDFFGARYSRAVASDSKLIA
jgi:hypothetical protein